MRTTTFRWTRPVSRVLLMAAAVGAVGLVGCEDPSSVSDAFLIRTPERRPSVSVPVTFRVATDDTESILFEWEPAPGATTYTITFWRGDSEGQVEDLEADFSAPLLEWEVTSPQIEDVLLNPENENDERFVRLVRFEVPESQVAAELEAAGLPLNTRIYTVFSVFAERGSERWRSPAVHPVILILEPEAP